MCTVNRQLEPDGVQEFNAAVLDYLVVSDCAMPYFAAKGSSADEAGDASASEEDVADNNADEELVPQSNDQTHRSTKLRHAETLKGQTGLRSVKSALHVDVPSSEGAHRCLC